MTKILFGRLRRDIMLLGTDADGETDLVQIAKDAVSQGRAAEAFIVEASAYFTEASISWDPEGTNLASEVASIPPLNPGQGEQESVDDPQPEGGFRTVKGNQDERNTTAPKGVDTGANPDGTPTGAARNEKELADGKPQGKVPEQAPAKTGSMDKK